MQWKFRLKYEVLNSDLAFWLTLQYDDEHLRMNSDFQPIVSKIDCQNYFRQLRKKWKRLEYPLKMSYFLVAEYGGKTNRPHYHCLMLIKFTELLQHEKMLEYRKYLYDDLFEHWYHGFVKEKTFHSGVINYLTKYVFKVNEQDPPQGGQLFRLISHGIGVSYLDRLSPTEKKYLVFNGFKSPDGYLPKYLQTKLTAHYYRPGIPVCDMLPKEFDNYYRISQAKRNLQESWTFKQWSKFNSLQEYEQYQKDLRVQQLRLFKKKQLLKYG